MKELLSAPLSSRKLVEYLLLFLLLASILSAAVYGGYWYGKQQVTPPQTASSKTKESSPQKVTDETAGWKTYTNKEMGYEIKVPESMHVEENVYGDANKDVTRFGPLEAPPNFEIIKSSKRQWADGKPGYEVGPYLSYGKFNGGPPSEKGDVLVEAFLEFEYRGSWYEVHTVYFSKVDKIETLPEDFNKSLSTFRFLDQN